MKATYKVKSNLVLEFECETQIDLFSEIAHTQEVFEFAKCGACGSDQIRHIERQNEAEDKFYELHCKNPSCRCRLVFGANKKPKGALYPKVRWDSLSPTEKENRADEKDYADKHFGFLPNEGWYKFTKKDKPAAAK